MMKYRLDAKKLKPRAKRTGRRRYWWRFCKLLASIVIVAGISVFALQYISKINELFYSSIGSWNMPVKTISLSGNNKVSGSKIVELSKVQLGDNIFLIDIAVVKNQIEKAPWVKNAAITRLPPNVLMIKVEEETASAIYNERGKFWLINQDGKILDEVPQKELEGNDMLTINGENANLSYGAVWKMLSHHGFRDTIARLEFVGKRRWNLISKNGAVIKLPEANLQAALDAFINLPQYETLLSLPTTVDLRLIPDKIYVKPCSRLK